MLTIDQCVRTNEPNVWVSVAKLSDTTDILWCIPYLTISDMYSTTVKLSPHYLVSAIMFNPL